jgi:hypothetical protein
MATKKKTNGTVETHARYERIGSETRTVKREIEADELETKKLAVFGSNEEERKLKATFREFKRGLLPKVEAVFDPDDEADLEESASVSLDGGALDFEKARALNDAIETERKITAAKVALVKAERRKLIDQVANRYEYRTIECDVEADNERLTVRYVDPITGEVIDTRGMSDSERQTALDIDELPSGGAPAAVS